MTEKQLWIKIQTACGASADGKPGIRTARATILQWLPNAAFEESAKESDLWKLIQDSTGTAADGIPGKKTAQAIYDIFVVAGERADWLAIQKAAGIIPADGYAGDLTAMGILSKWMTKVTPASSTKGVWAQIQEAVGTSADGIPGKKTARAIIDKWVIESDGDTAVDEDVYPEDPEEDSGKFVDLYPNDEIDARVHKLCIEVLSVFETGSKAGNYSKVTVYNDGPNKVAQITYGRCQTTESGNLKDLLSRYISAGPASAASKVIANRLPKVGKTPYLTKDTEFINALKEAGSELVMQQVQDKFFDEVYFNPAYRWFHTNGFTKPLSMLVIFDSFIHSGSILSFLRNRFKEVPPASGGDENKWIADYTNARYDWLANHSSALLRKTVYRPKCFKDAIAKDNWDLRKPINANGVPVL